MKKFLWSTFEIVETIVIAGVAVFLVRSFVAQPFLVSGSSMEPNFQSGNYLLIDELVYRFREPARGEVIVFKYPGDNRSYYIKRIIGLPGERVRINDGRVSVYNRNGEKILTEPYITKDWSAPFFEIELKENDYFVMGDNRSFSFDSRNWGALPKSNIVGLVRLRLWPINEAMAFSTPAY